MFSKKFKEDLLKKVNDEYNFSINSVKKKRQVFREKYKMLLNVGDDNKIYDRTMFSIIDMLCAMSVKFRPTVSFSKRDEGDRDTVKMLERVKEFDYDEMDMGWKKYRANRYKFVFGAGIEVEDGFDPVTCVPRYKVITPLCRISDASFDINTGFRFHGFEREYIKDELEALITLSDISEVQMIEMNDGRTVEQQQTKHAIQANRNIQDSVHKSNIYSVYEHRTYFEGKARKVFTGNDRKILLHIEEIVPVYEEEKKDNSKVGLGVVVRRWRPLPGDPYGVSVAFDLLADKQKQKQVLYNLNLIKAKLEAYGGLYLYDSNVVTADLSDRFSKAMEGPAFVPAKNLAQNPNPLIEMPRSQVKSDSVQYTQVLDDIIERSVSIDERGLGLSGPQAITKGESDRIQMNANVRHLLSSNFDLLAEKQFYLEIRYRTYKQHMTKSSKKFVELVNGLGTTPMFIQRTDFITRTDPSVYVESTLEKTEKKQQKRQEVLAIFNTLYQSATSEFGRKELVRYVADLFDIEDEIINKIVGVSPDEIQARLDLDIINAGQVPKVGSLDENHDVFIDIYSQARNTEAKNKAISQRRIAKMMAGQMQQQQQQQSPMDQGQQNMVMSNAIGKMNQSNTPSFSQV